MVEAPRSARRAISSDSTASKASRKCGGLGSRRGEFQTADRPSIDDPRVSFVQGWFSETLPGFVVPPHDQLIVNVDSDLYSSAKTVLSLGPPPARAGALLYFDEFADRDHELRALKELIKNESLQLVPIAGGGGGADFLFKVRDRVASDRYRHLFPEAHPALAEALGHHSAKLPRPRCRPSPRSRTAQTANQRPDWGPYALNLGQAGW